MATTRCVRLENLHLPEGDPCEREIAGKCLESIARILPGISKVPIRRGSKYTFNELSFIDNAIYTTYMKLYVPEAIIREQICSDSYIDIPDLVEILKKAKYYKSRVIPDNFYKQLMVATPVDDPEPVDTMVFQYRVIRRIAIDLGIKVEDE